MLILLGFDVDSNSYFIVFSHAHAVLSPAKYISYEGEEAVFDCTFTVIDTSDIGGVILVVDGEALTLNPQGQSQRGIVLSTHVVLNDTVCQWNFTVEATQTNNNITLGCVIFGYGLSGQTTSNTATFKVQGKYP